MLRKIFVFALTSGLLKKAYDAYKDRQAQKMGEEPARQTARRRTRTAEPVLPTKPSARRRSSAARAST